MVERQHVVTGLPLLYEGILNVDELFKEIEAWSEENGYTIKRQLAYNEKTVETGRFLENNFEILKPLNEYSWRVIVIDVKVKGIRDIEVEKDDVTLARHHGKVEINLVSFYQTDLENRWELKPGYMVVKHILDKYLLKPATEAPEGKVGEDTRALHQRLKAFLNLYRY